MAVKRTSLWLHAFLGLSIVIYFCYRLQSSEADSNNLEIIDLSTDGSSSSIAVDIDTAHRNGLPHRGCWIIVLDKATDEILFVQRSNSTVTCPSAWNVLGEHTKVGESYREAAIRGAREELGLSDNQFSVVKLSPHLDLMNITYPSIQRRDLQWVMTFGLLLHARVRSSKPFQNNRESNDFKWIPRVEASKWITHCDGVGGSSLRCRCCRDMEQIEVTVNGVRRVYNRFADLVAEKIELLMRY